MLQLISATGQQTVDALAFLLAFALTALMDSVFHDKLPHDHGRAFAVNGELSKGKARGSGLIFVLCIALVTLAVVPFKVEYLIYTVLLIASMLSGYFDDASETAWNEYKKGLIDFVIAVVAGVTYLNFNGTSVNFMSTTFTIAYPLYLLLIVILIWASINVVNCTDGVDGLSASLAVVSIGTFLLAYGEELGDYSTAAIVFKTISDQYGKYSFVMPDGKVSVEAEFVKTASTSFADVPADSYYAQAVAWAIENGITAGVGGGRFDPNSTCTRAQIATFLHRSYLSK